MRRVPDAPPGRIGVLLGALVVLDHGGRVLAWSTPAEALYGWSAEEAVGHPLDALVGLGPGREEAHRGGLPGGGEPPGLAGLPGLRARRRRDGAWITVDVLRIAVAAAAGEEPWLLDYSRNPAEPDRPGGSQEALALFPAALQLAMAEADEGVRDLTLCPYCNWAELAPGRWVDPLAGRVDLARRRLTPGLCPACARVEGIGR